MVHPCMLANASRLKVANPFVFDRNEKPLRERTPVFLEWIDALSAFSTTRQITGQFNLVLASNCCGCRVLPESFLVAPF